jgi:hypothetical protein
MQCPQALDKDEDFAPTAPMLSVLAEAIPDPAEPKDHWTLHLEHWTLERCDVGAFLSNVQYPRCNLKFFQGDSC